LTAVLMAVTLLGTGAVLLSSRTLGDESRPGQNAVRLPPAGKEDGKAKSEENAKKEKERLQGTWKLVMVEGNGESKKDEEDGRFVFSGDEFTFKKGDQVLYQGKFKLDLSKNPKAIDLEIAEAAAANENRKGKTSLGIYALDGDNLKLCVAKPGEADRPTKIAGEAGTTHTVFTLDREKK
jgi:uncharacterized protein (TIGR03067 family)